MSEENTTENQAPIDPELSESPELEDGELSEAELDAQSGGSAFPGASDPSLLQGDVLVKANIDSSYTSYYGATGTTGNEASRNNNHMVVNLTHHFP